MAKILIVEDDEDLLESLSKLLKSENHSVEAVSEGDEGLQRLQVYDYDLAILDWGLPGLEGTEICRRYRAGGGNALILMLTGKATIADRESGLDSGADDYLSKPFNMRELSARVRALLRRAGSAPSEENTFKCKNIELNTASCKVTKDGQEITLSRKEYALLESFIRNPNRVYSVDVLLRDIWNDTPGASAATVRTHIKTLRKKIEGDGDQTIIDTVHGVGYKLKG